MTQSVNTKTDKTKAVYWVFSISEHNGTCANQYNTPERQAPFSNSERWFTSPFDTYAEALSAIDAYFKDGQFCDDELIIQKVYTYEYK